MTLLPYSRSNFDCSSSVITVCPDSPRATNAKTERSDQNNKNRKVTNNSKPVWGSSVETAPVKATTIKSSQNTCYYREGIYYRPDQKGNYQVGPAPVGIRMKSLQKGFSKVLLGGISYVYYYGIF